MYRFLEQAMTLCLRLVSKVRNNNAAGIVNNILTNMTNSVVIVLARRCISFGANYLVFQED